MISIKLDNYYNLDDKMKAEVDKFLNGANLIHIHFLMLGSNKQPSEIEDDLLRFLKEIFMNNLDNSKYYEYLDIDNKAKEDLNTMGTWSKDVEEAREEGIKEGREEGIKESALRLAKKGVSVNMIASLLDIDKDTANKWVREYR